MAQIAIDGRALKQVRLAKGMASKDLAKKAGISERGLLEIENGGRSEGVREKTLFAICKVLGIEVGVICPAAVPVPAGAAPAKGARDGAGKKTA